MTDSHEGACFCGAVTFKATGTPALQGYCHCEDCRRWMGAPVNAFSLWLPAAVQITKGTQQVGVFNKTPHSFRKFCKVCGGSLMTEHPTMGLVDVYPAIMASFRHEPTMHVHYGSRMIAMKDGLPKFRDLPAEAGGSGETLPE